MEGRRTEPENKLYRVVITEINKDSGEEKELMDDQFTSIDMVADDAEVEGRMCEVMLNDNIHRAAVKLANAKKLNAAVRLAHIFMSMKDDHMADLEDMLAEAVSGETEGGIQ